MEESERDLLKEKRMIRMVLQRESWEEENELN